MRRSLVILGCMLMAHMAFSAAMGGDHARLDIRDQVLRATVAQAVAGAARRLNDPKCERILSDFRDMSGRLLSENLDALQLSPAQYLATIWLLDGTGMPECGPHVAAFTQPRSHLVYICGSQFVGRARVSGQTNLELVLIHELLHSLGLGENGRHPTSAAITRKVAMCCNP